jgi:Na+/H+-dicarboxylate symporter
VVAELGFDVLSILAKYMFTVVLGLLVHGFLVLPTILRTLGGMGFLEFLEGARPAMAVALSTSSSSATLPVSIDVAEIDLGCDPRHAGFVLPLGATVWEPP